MKVKIIHTTGGTREVIIIRIGNSIRSFPNKRATNKSTRINFDNNCAPAITLGVKLTVKIINIYN